MLMSRSFASQNDHRWSRRSRVYAFVCLYLARGVVIVFVVESIIRRPWWPSSDVCLCVACIDVEPTTGRLANSKILSVHVYIMQIEIIFVWFVGEQSTITTQYVLFAKCHTFETIFVTGFIHLRFLNRTSIADQSIIHPFIQHYNHPSHHHHHRWWILFAHILLPVRFACVFVCVVHAKYSRLGVQVLCLRVCMCVYYFYTFTFILGLVYLRSCTLNLVHDACRARVERAKPRALYKMDYGLWTLGVTKQFRKTERTYADEHAR